MKIRESILESPILRPILTRVPKKCRALGNPGLCVLLIALFLFPFSAPHAESRSLTIGLIPEQNVFKQLERYRPIGHYIQKKTDIPLRFTILSRYGNIIGSFREKRLDGAFWGSFTGALAIHQAGVVPIARPVWPDGSSTYNGYIFVRKDSGIESVDQMKGKTIAFVEKATTAGYMFPIAYLYRNGVTDIGGYFKEHYFAGSHDAAIRAVIKGDADIGCAKNTIYHQVVSESISPGDELVILAQAPPVPSNALGLSADLDPDVVRRIKDALLGMEHDQAGRQILDVFGAMRFIPTSKRDYEPVFRIAEDAGLDLDNYQYVNR